MTDMNSGAMISGKWLNMNNNQVVNVMDTIIDDAGMMIVMTDRGSIGMNEFSSNFIQCDDATLAEMTKVNAQKKSSKVEIERDFIVDVSPAVHQPPVQVPVTTVENKKTDTSSIIDRLFSKIETKPKINVSIEWDEFPNEQVDMLINFLDVKQIDISRYIFDNYLDEYALLGALSEFLERHIQKDSDDEK